MRDEYREYNINSQEATYLKYFKYKLAELIRKANIPPCPFTFADIINSDKLNGKTLSLLKKYIDCSFADLKIVKNKGIYLFGKVGSGKTTIMSILGQQLCRIIDTSEYKKEEDGSLTMSDEYWNKRDVLFVNSYNLVENILHRDSANKIEYKNMLKTRTHLIIDDVDKYSSSNYIELLYEIVDERMKRGRITHFTCNKSLKDLWAKWKESVKYSDRDTFDALFSRLKDCVVEVEWKGEDRRHKYSLSEFELLLDKNIKEKEDERQKKAS